jgi:hypothetical protein
MSGAQGRFQSVDPGNAGANPADPQTWNAYAYVGNNPLSYTDPSGLGFWSDFLDILGIGLDIAGILTLDPALDELGTIALSGEGVGLLATGTALEIAGIGPNLVAPLSLGMNPMLPATAAAAAGGGGVVIGGGTISIGAIGEWVLGALGCAAGGCETAAVVGIGAGVVGGAVYVGTHWGAPPKPQPTIWHGGQSLYPSYATTLPGLGLTLGPMFAEGGGGKTGQKVNTKRADVAKAQIDELGGKLGTARVFPWGERDRQNRRTRKSEKRAR